MNEQTKIQLSPFEMDLLNNSEWILTKNLIVKKAQRLLEKVQENILEHVKGVLCQFATGGDHYFTKNFKRGKL